VIEGAYGIDTLQFISYIHTYKPFTLYAHVLQKLLSYEENSSPSDHSLSGVSAVNPLVAFYDIHGRKKQVLFFYFVPDTTRDILFDVNNKSALGQRGGLWPVLLTFNP
jgi:hypothetical protein